MVLHKPSCLKLAIFPLLLLVVAASCKKYRAASIDFASWGYYNETYDMAATDEVTVTYPIEASGTARITKVTVLSAEPSITSSWTTLDSDNTHQVRLTLRTAGTPGGTYPIRITLINQDGAFIERMATIAVLDYMHTFRDTSARYEVVDTLDYSPFDPDIAAYQDNYQISLHHYASQPANQFVFSSLGQFPGFGEIDQVTVTVDSLSGELTVPLQNTSGLFDFSGHGKMMKPYGYRQIWGYFYYSYRTSGGTKYEGHLSFYRK